MSMRAVVFKGVGSIQVEDRATPTIQDCRDAIIKYRGYQKIPVGFIPGHEFAGVIHELGSQVTGLTVGDSVVTPNKPLREKLLVRYAEISVHQHSRPSGNSAGATSIDGGQAKYVRVPYASSTLVKRPKEMPEDMLVLMGDIFPTGYFAASRFLKSVPQEEAKSSTTVVVGCDPVSICAIAAASGWCDNIIAVDLVPERDLRRSSVMPLQ
ncbi:hypothetical protein LCI18_006918 [Fusarium solani-melongenae]|uniref:Uncharacterized protein n=1 Tax=Fusarium solani subsp. cucurbitae TaxID=2747967 RepID=A0ACD3Z4I5_FUSSC|nr:hypothetical protein LCI18_006918 [Fusarium solani-melongenae]